MAASKDATGTPAAGTMEGGAPEPIGRPGFHHWKQSTITEPGIDDRGGVFFAAVEMTRMPMVLADPRLDDCPIVFANNAFLDLTGYEQEEVIGRTAGSCRVQGRMLAHVRQLREAIEHREAVSLEILNYRRDGTPFWNGVFLGPVYDEAGQLLYFFASQLDVSKRRESEVAMRQAQKMEAIGQLTAGLAHDFNNLLHVMSGSLERLEARRDDDAAFTKYLAAARSASERGSKLTRQLLAFARRTRLEPRGVDLTELVNSFSELLETSVGERQQLHLNLQRRLPKVRVDPTHLEMAVLNVIVNARDASPEGGRITVTTEAVQLSGDAVKPLEAGSYVLLSVADQGTGMPPHIIARATEPFFTTKGVGQGTGLGLAMAHGFAQQSGGLLQIESAQGEGTTIRMYFPEQQPERDEAAATKSPSHPGRALEQSLSSPPLILVVDDSHEIAELARDALAEIGYRVVVAYSAEEALLRFEEALATSDPFKLVFSDVLMPGGANGIVLAEQIKERDPDVPIVLTTGYNDEMSIDGPPATALDVLGKPYRRSELIDRLQAALRSGARTGPRRQTSDFGHVEA